MLLNFKPCKVLHSWKFKIYNPTEVFLSEISTKTLYRVNPRDLWIVIAGPNCYENCFLMKLILWIYQNVVIGGIGTQPLCS